MYENELSSSEWFVSLAFMLSNYGINFILDEELYIKDAVKHMIFHLKNEFISNWEIQVNNALNAISFINILK